MSKFIAAINAFLVAGSGALSVEGYLSPEVATSIATLVTLILTEVARRMPTKPSSVADKTLGAGIVMVVALGVTGCGGGYLTPARGPSKRLAASPELSEYCQKLDTKVFRSTVATYVGAGLAGVAVVPPILADEKEWIYAGAGTAAAGAVVGLVATPIKVGAEKRFQERCE